MRRRIIVAALLAATLALALPLAAAAGTPSLAFQPNGDDTCTVTGIGSVRENEIVIPTHSPAGDTVTKIGDGAFTGNTNIRRVTLPDTVSEIGTGCFYGCSSLVEITLPAGVTAVPDYAFCDCAALARVLLPDGIRSIGEDAFGGCCTLAAVSLPDALETIGPNAFAECAGLSTVTVPARVTSIAGEAFRDCASLSSILFLSAGTEINLTETALPAGAVIYAPEDSGAAKYASVFKRTFRPTEASLPTLALTGAVGAPGEEIDLALTLSRNPGFNFLKIKIRYDASVLSLVSCKPVEEDGCFFEASRTVDVLPYVLVFASAGNRDGDDAIAHLRFRVADGAPEEAHAVSVSVEQCFDEDGLAPVFLTDDAVVTVRTVFFGDASGDGVIDGRDLTLLLDFLAGAETVLDPSFADVYPDGLIDGRDVTLLMQYLADWDVVLGAPIGGAPD